MEKTAAAFSTGRGVAGAAGDLVALGGGLDVEALVAAYRSGCFPWPASGPYEDPLDRDARRLARRGDVPVLPGTDFGAPLMPWVSPHPRPVLFPHKISVPRALRRRLRQSGRGAPGGAALHGGVPGRAERLQTRATPAMQPGD